MCGSQAAKALGIEDSSAESLTRFDDWYFGFYPYLKPFLKPIAQPGLRVLEVGLGYGSVSQFLQQSQVGYSGLDIADGPVNMVNARFAMLQAPGRAYLGSILSPPFEPESFDAVVAIGSLHHTGDLQRAISVCQQLLVPGGRLLFMVYNAYSYRRWLRSTSSTVRYISSELMGYRGVVGTSSERQRGQYDVDSSGQGAPHTDWISRRSLSFLLRDFTAVNMHLYNMDVDFPPFRRKHREDMLRSAWGTQLGLDVYVTAVK